VIDYIRERVVPKIAFDESQFTKRELRNKQALAQRFRDSLSKPMIDVTHAELGPWQTIWDEGRGNDERIPYALALAPDDPHRDAILASAHEYAAMKAARPN
jgi:hypothetical protein